ncbi:MAG TPA: hypothetical protein VHS59_14365 [Bacillota bacterium]|nr:hypothetical protein [Bacillota bacterium]
MRRQNTQGIKRLITVLTLILSLLISTTAGAGTGLDLFLTPKQVYLAAEYKALNQSTTSIAAYWDKIYQHNVKPFLDSTVRQDADFQINVSGLKTTNDTVYTALELLNNSKVSLQTNFDVYNKKDYTNLGWSVKDKHLLGLELYTDNTYHAVRLPEIYDKYLVMDSKEVKKPAPNQADAGQQLAGLVNLFPQGFYKSYQAVQLYSLGQEEIDIIKGLGKIYADSVTDKNVTMKQGVFTQGTTSIPTRVFNIAFTEQEYKLLLKKIAYRLSFDDQVIKVLTKKQNQFAAAFATQSQAAFPEMYKPMTPAQMKKQMAAFYRDFNLSLNKTKLPKGLKMIVQLDENDNIIDRQIAFIADNSITYMRKAGWKSNEGLANWFALLRTTDKSGVNEIRAGGTNGHPDGLTDKGSVILTVKETVKQKTTQLFRADSDYTYTRDDLNKDLKADYRIQFNTGTTIEKFGGTLESTEKNKDNNKVRENQAKFTLNLDGISSQDFKGTVITMTGTTKTEFGKPFTGPAITPANSVDLLKLKDQEIDKLFEDLDKGFNKFITENKEVFGSFGPIPSPALLF